MVNPYAYANPIIRLAIADDHPFFRKGLSDTLKKYAEFHVIGEASNGQELVEIVEEQRPDIVLTDINMPRLSGIQATRIIQKQFPATNVIALSMADEEHIILRMLEAGAKGYLLKNADEGEMVQAVYAVYRNGIYYCTATTSKLVRLIAVHNVDSQKPKQELHFSERDIQIIQLLCQERGSKEIAVALNMSCRAVEGVKQRIQEKIGARNMIGIALYAIHHGLFTLH